MIPAPPSTTKKEEDKDDDHVDPNPNPWQQGGYLSDEHDFPVRKAALRLKREEERYAICENDKELGEIYDLLDKAMSTPTSSPTHDSNDSDEPIQENGDNNKKRKHHSDQDQDKVQRK